MIRARRRKKADIIHADAASHSLNDDFFVEKNDKKIKYKKSFENFVKKYLKNFTVCDIIKNIGIIR